MKVSIITINYNNAEGLRKTVESIVNQSKIDFEYIVIDGNSKDGSVDIIKQYKDKIDYWVSEPDAGIYNAMNKGIHRAKGEYVIFINSGDIVDPTADLNDIIAKISGEDIVYFNMKIADCVSNTEYVKQYPDHPDFKYFAGDTLPHTASFIRKQMLVDYGCYSEKLKITSDWAFFIDAICLNKCSYKHINNSFSTFFVDGISSNPENRKMLLAERDAHIAAAYPLYNSLYKEWIEKRDELYKLKTSASVKYLKKLGFLKWLKI